MAGGGQKILRAKLKNSGVAGTVDGPKPGFPIWSPDSRITRLSCPQRNEFATRANLSEINGVPTARFCPSDEPRLLPRNRFLRHYPGESSARKLSRNGNLGNTDSSSLSRTDPIPIRSILPRLEIASSNSVETVQLILFYEK